MGERIAVSLTVRQARMVRVVLSEMADVTHDASIRRDCIFIYRRIDKAIAETARARGK